MENLPTILTWLSGPIFIIYGFLCLFAGGMSKEFERYGLTRYRKLVGFLELLGGLGSMIGLALIYPVLLIFSSAGLGLLMFFGIIVRIKLKDPIVLILPAIALMIINIYICSSFI